MRQRTLLFLSSQSSSDRRRACLGLPMLYSAFRRLAHTSLVLGLLALWLSTAGPVRASDAIRRVSQSLITAQEQKALPTISAVERDLKGGETHSYRVSLTSGEFFYALVEQKGIDVVVTLSGPEAEKLSVTDSPNDRWDSEPILIIATRTGDYRVDVSSPNSRVAPGRYEIRIIAQREASPADKGHMAAQRLLEESEKLRQQPPVTAKRQAIEKNQQALALFEAAGDTYRQAVTARQTAFAFGQLNEFRTALGYANQALSLAQKLGNRRVEGSVLNFLGFAFDFLGDVGKALEHYERALSLARETGSQSTEASTLNNIGKIYNDMADRQKALEYYQQALPIFRSIGVKRTEGIALNNIGVAYNMVGEPRKAIDYLQQALPLLRSAGDKNAESYTLSNIGNAFSRSGDYAKALDYYNQAQAIQKETGNRAQQAETLDLIGETYLAQGQPEKALEYHQEAVQFQRATGNVRREAISLNHVGRAYNLLGQPEKALAAFQPALSTLRAIRDLSGVSIALEGSARAERTRGNLDEAQKLVEQALAVIETVRTRSASQQLRAAYLASMKRAFEFYVDLLMQRHAQDPSRGYDAEALRASERGRARSLTEMLVEANVDIRHGVDGVLIERERNLMQLLNAKAQRQIQLLAQKGSKEELDTLAREISALEDDYEQIKTAIRKNSPQYAALTQPQPLGLKEIQRELDANTLLLEYSLGEEQSYLWAVTPNTLKSYELPKRAQIQKTARQVVDLLTTRSASKQGETLRQKQTRLAEADERLLTATRELSDLVLGPVASELGSKRLVVVADDALLYVPFGALSVVNSRSAALTAYKYRPLILDHEIILLPSATAIGVQRNYLAGRKPGTKAVAVIADPVFSIADDRLSAHVRTLGSKGPLADGAGTRIIEHSADDSTGRLALRRLRFTRQEAEQILAVSPRASNLRALDFRASRATVTGPELSQFRYVHFATHGYLDSERADLSAVVLSLVDEQGNPQDGFLRTHEIYNLHLPAELVVLSACQTGLGKEIKGEGLVGLTRGFMYAGAARVVVSLWSVNDKATADLMTKFYEKMLKQGERPAAALRAAQVEMWRQKQWQSPYYWAGFTLQGEWR